MVIAISEDAVAAATERDWILLACDSEVLAEPLWPTFNPPRTERA